LISARELTAACCWRPLAQVVRSNSFCRRLRRRSATFSHHPDTCSASKRAAGRTDSPEAVLFLHEHLETLGRLHGCACRGVNLPPLPVDLSWLTPMVPARIQEALAVDELPWAKKIAFALLGGRLRMSVWVRSRLVFVSQFRHVDLRRDVHSRKSRRIMVDQRTSSATRLHLGTARR